MKTLRTVLNTGLLAGCILLALPQTSHAQARTPDAQAPAPQPEDPARARGVR